MAKKKDAAASASDAKKPPGKVYRALVPYSYELHGERKNGWTEVGIGFTSRDGEGVNVELRPGISVAGRLVLRPIDPKAENESQAGAAGQGVPRFVHDPYGSKDDLV